MKKKLLNNWLLKILSLLLAFTLWLVVINIEDPVDEKTFSNIKVNFINTNVLTDENRVYEVLEGTGVVRTVRVEASRKLLESLSESDIVAEADFSKVTVNETVEIKFYSTKSNEEIRNISGSIDMVKLSIEDKKTKRLSLTLETNGEPANGYIVGTPAMDQNRIEISGPESVVARVVSAGLKVDISDSDNDISTYADVVLYDADGKTVTSDALEMNAYSVKVRVPILATKEVPVLFNVMGEPAEGYLPTGVLEADQETVVIAGSSAVLASVNRIVVTEEELDITGLDTNLVKSINLKEYLPDGVSFAGKFNGKINVTVYIEAEQEKELKISAGNIRVIGMPEGTEYTAALDEDVTEYSVTVRGLQANLDAIEEDQILGFIQIDNLMESLGMEKLIAGNYQATVDLNLGEGIIQTADLVVNLHIVPIEEQIQ